MAQLSLILPVTPRVSPAVEPIRDLCSNLNALGHTVDCIISLDPGAVSDPKFADTGWSVCTAKNPGLSAAAVAGLAQAQGDVLLLLDGTRNYSIEDLKRVIEPVIQNEADLVISSPRVEGGKGTRWPLQKPIGTLSRRLFGTSDPLSGLVAISPKLLATTEFFPIGSLFALELAIRVDARRLDVPLSRAVGSPHRHWSIDDLRFAKRLSEERFGNFSRLIQFCLVGASGMIVDLSCYALFQWLLSKTSLASAQMPLIGGPLTLAVAAALAIGIALTWNFSLNRRLTFSYARGESILKQFFAYALSNALGIVLSYSLRLLLPRHVGYFQRHKLAAALVGIVCATGISFSMARWFVFARRHNSDMPEATGVVEAKVVEAVPASREAGDSTSSYTSPRNLSASALEAL